MSILKSLLKHDQKILKATSKNYAEEKISSDEILVIGVDEVGRGCLAGPVCTAAYTIRDLKEGQFGKDSKSKPMIKLANEKLLFLNDSKQVSAKNRIELCKALKKYPETLWSVDLQPADQIDKIGIVNCIWQSMTNNIKNILDGLKEKSDFPRMVLVYVDGPKTIFGLEMFLLSEYGEYGLDFVEQAAIVKGDSKSALIAAASNIAKDFRDKYMQELAADFPHYAWTTNVGYGTLEHRNAIAKYGPCQYHRMSFLSKELLSA